MALKSNPNREGGEFPTATPGRKIVACVGSIKQKAKTSSNMLERLHMIVLHDFEGADEPGTDVWDNLMLTQAAVWRIDKAAKAAGWTQEFDADDHEQMVRVMTHAPFEINLVEEFYNGEARVKVVGTAAGDAGYYPLGCNPQPEWTVLVDEGFKSHEKIVAAIERKRAAAAQRSSGPTQRPSSQPTSTEPSAQDFEDPEIPF